MSDCGNVEKVFVPNSGETIVPTPKGFDVTEEAAKKIKHFLHIDKKDPAEFGLRIKVVKDGCSGNSYTMDLYSVKEGKENGDKFFSKDDAIVMVEKLSYLFVIGSTLDFKETLLASGFELKNPNIKNSCSCGSSFSVK
jgi:iron-sulfur cluster assembly accessory protein